MQDWPTEGPIVPLNPQPPMHVCDDLKWDDLKGTNWTTVPNTDEIIVWSNFGDGPSIVCPPQEPPQQSIVCPGCSDFLCIDCNGN